MNFFCLNIFENVMYSYDGKAKSSEIILIRWFQETFLAIPNVETILPNIVVETNTFLHTLW